MGSNTDPFYGAPVILIVLGKKDWPTHVYDGSLVMGNLMLAAHDLGIGSCWIHRAKEEFESDWGRELLKSLGIEDEYEGIGHCALGYVDGDYPDVIPRKENRVGAMARYAISLIPLKTEFPFLTLITNVIGAILIGFIVGITSGRDGVSKNMVLFWKTGVCGGFTTFSTFSLEAYNLFEHNHCLLGCGYVVLSCLGCILGVMCGEKLAAIIK